MVTTGRARHEIRVGVDLALHALFDIALGDPAGTVAKLADHQLGGIGVEHLGDGRHHAQAHQRLDHIDSAGRHAVGEFLHGDRVGQDDVANDAHLVGAQRLELLLAALALALTADAGQAAGFLVLAFDGGLHVDAAAATAFAGTLLGDDGCRRAACRQETAGATHATGVILLLAAGAQTQRLGRGGWRTAGRARRWARTLARGARGRRRGLDSSGRPGGRRRRIARCNRRCFGTRPGLVLRDPAGLHLGRPALIFLPAARFLGSRQDHDLLRLAPLGVALGVLFLLLDLHALLLDERALAGCLLGRRQRAATHGGLADRGRRASTRAWRGATGRARLQTAGGRRPVQGCRSARRGLGRRGHAKVGGRCRGERRGPGRTLLAHLDLHGLRPSVRKTLLYAACIHRTPKLETAGGAQRQARTRPVLSRILPGILITSIAHSPACLESVTPEAPASRSISINTNSASRPEATAT